jgi:hypothetical protein
LNSVLYNGYLEVVKLLCKNGDNPNNNKSNSQLTGSHYRVIGDGRRVRSNRRKIRRLGRNGESSKSEEDRPI